MSIVNTQVPITAQTCNAMIEALVEKYPFCRSEVLTATAFQRLAVGMSQPRRRLISRRP